MQRSNVPFLEKQLISVLGKNDSSSWTFVIDFDPEEAAQPKTNFDEIMYHWSLPKKVGLELDLQGVCEALVTGLNHIPLWIRIETDDERRVCRLYFSKRFRKIKEVKNWHGENENLPFII